MVCRKILRQGQKTKDLPHEPYWMRVRHKVVKDIKDAVE